MGRALLDSRPSDLAFLLRGEEESEVDLKDRLEQSHVGSLVETDLVLPNVDDEDLGDGN